MGRLFQYNRLGNTENASTQDSNLAKSNCKDKLERQAVANCPAYSELYPDYNAVQTTLTSTATMTATTTTTATSTTTMTAKSVELAIKKYQQWSSKLLLTTSTSAVVTATTTATTATTAVETAAVATAAATEPVSQCTSCASTTSFSSHSCSATAAASSGYHSHSSRGRLGQQPDQELLISAVKRPKVYDCMKDFLKRKLFQQHTTEAKPANVAAQDEEEDDATSDYDEVDMLDSSYNADEEDATDCSSDCTCPLESSSEDDDADDGDDEEMLMAAPHKTCSPQKSVLSLSCWQHSFCTDANTTEEETAEDSDAGISDCCQLIADRSPKRRSPKKSVTPPPRYNLDDDELPELLESSWYQPRITTKAAMERLQSAQPGSFLVRRKARTYELCVRVETKVKQFTVVSAADNYKLKGARKQFSSLKALVTHHSVMAEQLPLTLALPREQQQQLWTHSSVRCADDFDTFESLQILGILKSLQAKSLEFA